jgi:hypothetical protein
MNIVIPIPKKRFYYNHKMNCIPASGTIRYGKITENISPENCLGQLDWGRGVWEYSSFWLWASASGYLSDGRSIGLNLGGGFGDTSNGTENCFILNGRLHKLDMVDIQYNSQNYLDPWSFQENHGRLNLDFFPYTNALPGRGY